MVSCVEPTKVTVMSSCEGLKLLSYEKCNKIRYNTEWSKFNTNISKDSIRDTQ